MKHAIKIGIVLAFLVTAAGCDRNTCQNVSCPIGQACNSGQCYCSDGFEGADCQTISAQKYIGNYNFSSENCTPITPFTTANVFIQQGNFNNQIEIYNLMGSYCTFVTAIIRTDFNNEGNILEIPEQNSNCSGNSVSGQGRYDKLNNRIILELYYTFGGISYQCNTTLQ